MAFPSGVGGQTTDLQAAGTETRSQTHAVDSRFETSQDVYRGRVVVRNKLHQHGHADSAVWVDPEVGVVFAAPTNGAERAHAGCTRGRLNLKAEAEPILSGSEWKRPGQITVER